MAGIGLGVADRVTDCGVDVSRYNKGEISGKRLAFNTVANTIGIALLAVPVAGHLTAAIPGQVGHILQTGTNAIASTNLTVGIAAGGSGAVELASGIHRARRSIKDRPERQVIQVRGNEKIPYRDPLQNGKKVDILPYTFFRKMKSVGMARPYADPSGLFTEKSDEEKEKNRGRLRINSIN